VSSIPLAYFDRLADCYDHAWTNSPVGRLQRDAVWRELDHLAGPGGRVLDLGCGTGEDALHFQRLGAEVDAIDGSPKMVDAARRRGVLARLLRIEEIGGLHGSYDLVLSNFGALNCVKGLAALRAPLAALIRPGGALAICLLNRFCLWETVYYASGGQFKKARRRWGGEAETSSGLRVFYPSARKLRKAFAPDFRITRELGIGIAVPPSYVLNCSCAMLSRFAACDARIATSTLGRAFGDHRLFLFTRSR
jgi:SAM-dependent methyltransferase